MFSSFVNLFRCRWQYCDCCNHNTDIDLEALLDEIEMLERETIEKRQTIKKKFQTLLAALRWKRTKKTTQENQAATQKSSGWRYKSLYRKVRYMGKKRSYEVRRKPTHEATDIVSDTHERADPLKSAVHQLLTTMFADVVENDHALAKQTNATTQCFLVHPLSDLDPNGSFLSRYVHPSPQEFDMDFNLGLSFVSSWLQSSLARIKTLYPEGEISLQMPFCVLETTQANVNARARALQRLHPSENVGIATLDIVALKTGKLLASAEHTFDFLRVSRQGFPCHGKLLAWAESDEDGRSAEALRNALLTVVEWQESGEDTGGESEEAADAGRDGTASQAPVQDDESEEQWAKWANPHEKKDSGITSRTASGSSRSGFADSWDISAVEGERHPRLRTL